MRTVEIQNGVNTIIININESELLRFRESIKQSLKDPKEYPFIEYQDKSDYIIFATEYLRNSLIKFPI